MKCLQCKVDFQEKRPTAKYCSTSCRVSWNRKNKKVKIVLEEANNRSLLEDILDRLKKLDGLTTKKQDNVLQDSLSGVSGGIENKDIEAKINSLRKPKTMAKYVEERINCSNAEEYEHWLNELDSDPYLTSKQKEMAKIATL